MNRTGRYLAERREARGFTRAQLAAAVGYRNIGKGARRIVALERENAAVGDLVERVVRALDLDPEHVRSLVEADRRDAVAAWERWADEPVEPELRFRPIAALWIRTPLPAGLSRADAVAYASGRAVTTGMTHVLVWSRREEAWCYPDGSSGTHLATPGEAAGPASIIGGARVVFGGGA
jgi:hypothetical protein